MTAFRRHDVRTRVAIILIVCLSVSLGMNLIFLLFSDDAFSQRRHSEHFHVGASPQLVTTEIDKVKAPIDHHLLITENNITTSRPRSDSRLAKLSCAPFGGPDDQVASEMIYWRDIPSDARYVSPFLEKSTSTSEEKFLLWDIDPAGFNNKRLSFENFVLLAHTMGRTLVIPPRGVWWGLSTNVNASNLVKGQPVTRWSMLDFYDIDQIATEQAGFKVISMEKFLEQHAMTGKLVDKNNVPQFPPDNRTDWNAFWQMKLKKYLQRVTTPITWRPEDCIGAFPAKNNDENRDELDRVRQEILKQHGPPQPSHWIGRPTPVDANVHDRMEEILTNRKHLCFYTPEQQATPYLYYKILYDPRNHTLAFDINIRLLIYFYCWLFFEDWHQDLWAKRFIRDHLRYKDELQCAAARIVEALRLKSSDGEFDVLHVRRQGEFETQYGKLTTAEEIVQSFQSDIPKNRTLYIATDEYNKSFFLPIEQYFDHKIWFLDDFLDLIPDININLYSIVDQLVATRGHKFFGAFCSTFTGYINRLRGYHSTKSKWEGYRNGALVNSFFYNFNREGKRDKMRTYHPPVHAWFFREYPLAWRDIDHDVDESEFVD